jgi:hypothetical protein
VFARQLFHKIFIFPNLLNFTLKLLDMLLPLPRILLPLPLAKILQF